MFLGQGLSLVCQAGYFICLGRLLGSTEYGIYIGAVALVAILAQYSALGSHSVFLRYVSPAPGRFSHYWANVVVTTAAMGLVCRGAGMGGSARLALLLSWNAGVRSGRRLRMRAVHLGGGRVFQALERMRVTAMLNLLTNTLRAVLAGTLLWTMHRAAAHQWVFATLIVSTVTAVIAVTLVTKYFGKPELRFAPVEGASWRGSGLRAFVLDHGDLQRCGQSHAGPLRHEHWPMVSIRWHTGWWTLA